MEQHSYKCVIFDCEGTLLDSEKLSCQALVSAFNSFGIKLSMEESLKHFDGGKLSDIICQTRDRLGVNVDVDELVSLYREKAQVLFHNQLKPSNNAVRLLKRLKEQGIEMCVVSNGPKNKLESKLKVSGLSSYFDYRMFSAFEANSWKPEPDLIQYVATHMGFKASECLFIDDTCKGVEAGLRAHIKTLHYRPNPLSPKLRDSKATEISDLTEVLQYVQTESVNRQYIQ